MSTYNFPHFTVEMVDPIVSEIVVSDNIFQKQCNVRCILTDSSGSKFGVQLGVYSYSKTWNDSDIEVFVNTELNKYLVNE